MPLKSLEYWVLAQLALDLGLFLLVIFFICQIRALSRLLHASQPTGAHYAEQIAELSKKLTAWEQHFEAWGNQPPNGMPDFPRQVAPGQLPGQEPPPFLPEIESGKSLRAQVAELAGRGLAPEEIARHLKLQAAEVRVALDLSRLLAKQEAGPL
jgi:hypothetical protein